MRLFRTLLNRSIAITVIAASAGCGGGGNASTTPAAKTTPVKLTINWGQRSRAINAPASALSATLTLTAANADGSNFVAVFDRDTSNTAAYTQNITTSNAARTGRWSMLLTFFAQADGTGSVVGTASETVSIASDGSGIGDVAAQGTIASVSLASGQSLAVGKQEDLVVNCRAADGSAIAVTPGSITYQLADSSGVIQVTGGQLVGVSGGEGLVTATVDGKTSTPAGVLVTGGDTTNPDAMIVNAGTVLLPADGSVTATAQTDTSVTLTGNVPALLPGAVLVGRTGYGFLRKVVSVQQQGSSTVVQTTNAALTDVFEQVEYTPNPSLGPPAQLSLSTPAASNVSVVITPANQSRAIDFNNTVSLGAVTVTAGDGDPIIVAGTEANPMATLSGSIVITPSVNFALSIRVAKLEHLRYAETLNVKATTDLKFFPSGAKLNVDVDYLPPLQYVFPDTPLGVPIVVKIKTHGVLTGEVTAGLDFSPTANLTLTAGLEYVNGAWQPVFSPGAGLTIPPLATPYASFSVESDPLVLTADVLIADIGGPTIEADLPYTDVTFAAQTAPPGVVITGGAGFRATAGAEIGLPSLLGFDISYSTPTFTLWDTQVVSLNRTIVDSGGLNLGVQ